ncbi:MAG: hypothetical protein ACTHLO_15980 [Pseudolabrys sp.]
MQRTGHKSGRLAADTTGWLLATIIVVLAVLDLLIWATLWNVPNPISKALLPQATDGQSTEPVSFTAAPDEAATLTGGVSPTLPRSRAQ